MRAALALWLVGCGADLQVTPDALSWGEVNFNAPRPPDGYDAREIVLLNTGKRALDIEFAGFDDVHLFLAAPFLQPTDPPSLPRLDAGSSTVVTVAPWDYELGELTTEVSGVFTIRADGLREPVPVTWRFTPVREDAVDTGAP